VERLEAEALKAEEDQAVITAAERTVGSVFSAGAAPSLLKELLQFAGTAPGRS